MLVGEEPKQYVARPTPMARGEFDLTQCDSSEDIDFGGVRRVEPSQAITADSLAHLEEIEGLRGARDLKKPTRRHSRVWTDVPWSVAKKRRTLELEVHEPVRIAIQNAFPSMDVIDHGSAFRESALTKTVLIFMKGPLRCA